MATATSVEDVILLASTIFPANVLALIKKAKFTMDDIHQLSRDDIDHEFKNFRFGIRKSLWCFFSAFSPRVDGVAESPTEETEPTLSLTTLAKQGVLSSPPKCRVNRSLQEKSLQPYTNQRQSEKDEELDPEEDFVLEAIDGQESEGNESMTPSFGASHNGVTEEISHSAPGSENLIVNPQGRMYPGNIAAPFPFSESSKQFLSNDIKSILKNKYQFNVVVREVCDIVWEKLDRKPTIKELRTVEENLYAEYPALDTRTSRTKSLFYQRMRKRCNCKERSDRKERQLLGQLEKLQSHKEEDPDTVMTEDANGDEMSVATIELSYNSDDGEQRPKRRQACGSKYKSTPSNLLRYLKPPTHILDDTGWEPYPGNIQRPFPLTDAYKKFMSSCTRKMLVENRYYYYAAVREVSVVLHRSLGRKPMREELKTVAKNLSIEYPVLQCAGGTNFNNLYYSFRKRMAAYKLLKMIDGSPDASNAENPIPKVTKPNGTRRGKKKRHRYSKKEYFS